MSNKQIPNEIREQVEATIKKRMALRPTSLATYSFAIIKFCDAVNMAPFDFEKTGLATIEETTETYIMQNIETLAPKYLNVIYNSVKTWCFCLHMIKSRKLFREIKFDKQSRKIDAMTEHPLETTQVKALMQISDAYEKVPIGLYGLSGIRPAIIPQLKVGDFDLPDFVIENGKIRFLNKNPLLFVRKEYKGNKAKQTFFVILCSNTTEQLEPNIE